MCGTSRHLHNKPSRASSPQAASSPSSATGPNREAAQARPAATFPHSASPPSFGTCCRRGGCHRPRHAARCLLRTETSPLLQPLRLTGQRRRPTCAPPLDASLGRACSSHRHRARSVSVCAATTSSSPRPRSLTGSRGGGMNEEDPALAITVRSRRGNFQIMRPLRIVF